MKLGDMDIDTPLILAPMEAVTDQPFRIICRRLGADILVTEFTSSEAIVRDIPRALSKLEFTSEERPIGIQLFGGVEESMEQAAQKAEALNPDFIDINCGCWVKNHVGRGEGAALLKDIKKFEAIVKATVAATSLPVTVKTRLGWDQENIIILDVAQMVEEIGAKALTVHCRVRTQAHKGNADWSWLEKIKKATSIPLIGNGDITCVQAAKTMLETGCDGIMIGRGAIANPWIFAEIKHFLATGEQLAPPTTKEKFQMCIEHLKLAFEFKGIRGGVIPFRKFYAGYLKGIPNVAKLRTELMKLDNLNKIIQTLNDFLMYNECQQPDSAPGAKSG